MIPYNPPLNNGPFYITKRNGYYGLCHEQGKDILPCVYYDMCWANDYLCIFNGEKWGIVHLRAINALFHELG